MADHVARSSLPTSARASFHYLDRLPRNDMGKVMKKALGRYFFVTPFPSPRAHDLPAVSLLQADDGPPISSQVRAIPIRKQTITTSAIVSDRVHVPGPVGTPQPKYRAGPQT